MAPDAVGRKTQGRIGRDLALAVGEIPVEEVGDDRLGRRIGLLATGYELVAPDRRPIGITFPR